MSFTRLASNAVATIGQILASAIILFFLFRFLNRSLGADRIGVWSLVISTTSIAKLSEFGIGSGISRFIAGDLGNLNKKLAAKTLQMAAVSAGTLMFFACVALYPLLHSIINSTVSNTHLSEEAVALIPYAIASVWTGTLGGIYLSALDGAQRTDVRAMISTAGSAVQLVGAYWLVPRWGVEGLGIAQIIQNGIVLVLAMFFCLDVIGPLFPGCNINRPRLKALMKFAGGMQVASVAQMAFDPVAKIYITNYSGLSTVGFFEMASRAAIQVRSIIASVFQLAIPYLATRARGERISEKQMRSDFLREIELMAACSTPYFCVVLLLAPLIFDFWLGVFNSTFAYIGLIVLSGWYANTFSLPAWNSYMVEGRSTWPVLTQIVTGLLNLAIGYGIGRNLGGLYSVTGVMISLAVGSSVVTIAFVNEFKISVRELLNLVNLRVIVSFVGTAVGVSYILVLWRGMNFINTTQHIVLTAIIVLITLTCFVRSSSVDVLMTTYRKLRRQSSK